jgi:peptidoglycan/xylan/chitin deacetylase (PgdA/CDA1 family)
MLSYYQNARRDQNKVAITFDDGPNPAFTPKIMEILAARKVRATFFMIGKLVEAEPTLTAEVLAAGHVIGNHTYSHSDARKTPGVQFWQDDLTRAEQAIQQATDKATDFFRMPYLAFAPDINTALRSWIGNRSILNANVLSYDWTHDLEKPLSAQAVINNIFHSPLLGPGALLLFHDGSENLEEAKWRPEPMVVALPIMIDTLQERGYELVAADELEFDSSCKVPLI